MTESQDRPGAPRPDALTPADAGLDPRTDAAVRTALAALPTPPMPADVWSRLASALATEQAARAADTVTPAPVTEDGIPLAPPPTGDPVVVVPMGTRTQRRAQQRSRRVRLLGGVVAASLVVVAAGIGLSALRAGGGAEPPVVAAGLPQRDDGAAVVPSLRVTESGTRYSQASFRTQVQDLLAEQDTSAAMSQAPDAAEGMAAAPGDLAVADPVGEDGFTSSWAGLRACVAGLAGSARIQAIVVDRATYEGRDAGIVVLPTVKTTATVDVWVVEPGCASSDPKVLFFFRAQVPD